MPVSSAAATEPSILLPESRVQSPVRHLRAVPSWSQPAQAPGPAVSAATVASTGPNAPRSRSYAPPSAKVPRPLGVGGAPPTVIRDLDALFAADRHRRSAPPPPPTHTPAPAAMDPKDLARALLDKVQRDFGSVPPPAPPVVHRFVVSAPTQRDEGTLFLALPDDDEDVMRLTPWYVRLYRAVFG